MPDRPVRFNQRSGDRVIDATMRVENQFYEHQNQRVFIPRSPGGAVIYDAISTSTITAFNSSTNTYGQGTCQPMMATANTNSNTNTTTYNMSPNNSFGNTNSILVLNGYTNNGNSVSSGIKIQVTPFCGVLLMVGGDQC